MQEEEAFTQLLRAWGGGDQEAMDRAITMAYQDLRRLAAGLVRSGHPENSLQATAVVHEVLIRLMGGGKREWEDRGHFFATACGAMRQVLIDHARKRRAAKRGGERPLSLDAAVDAASPSFEQLTLLHDCLDRLTRLDARQARVAELRLFGGLELTEIAAVMEVSERTARRDWMMAKGWLQGVLGEGRDTGAMGAD